MQILARLKLKYLILCSFIFGSAAQAGYLIVGWEPLELSKPTRLLFSGYADSMKNQFFESALMRAQRYRQLDPRQQVLIVRHMDWSEEKTVEKSLLANLQVLQTHPEKDLRPKEFLELLSSFRWLHSLDVYSHNSALVGIALNSYLTADRWHGDDPFNDSLKPKFAGQAPFVFLHGCNTGFSMASQLASKWDLLVFASYTGTDVQNRSQGGQWYFNNPDAYPEGVEWEDCQGIFCRRLMPQRGPYSGIWGRYEKGLNFFKAHCPSSMSSRECSKQMFKALKSFPHTIEKERFWSRQDLHQALSSFLCPRGRSGKYFNACKLKLLSFLEGEQVDTSYSTFPKAELDCDDRGCQASVECTQLPDGRWDPSSCRVRGDVNEKSDGLFQESMRYLRGFEESSFPFFL